MQIEPKIFKCLTTLALIFELIMKLIPTVVDLSVFPLVFYAHETQITFTLFPVIQEACWNHSIVIVSNSFKSANLIMHPYSTPWSGV